MSMSSIVTKVIEQRSQEGFLGYYFHCDDGSIYHINSRVATPKVGDRIVADIAPTKDGRKAGGLIITTVDRMSINGIAVDVTPEMIEVGPVKVNAREVYYIKRT